MQGGDKMNIGEKIKYLRLDLKLTQEELANAAGTTKQTIHKYETGIISNIPASKIKAMADKLNTTPAYLMGWEEKYPEPDITEEYVTFPVIGDIAAGYGLVADENWSGDTIDVPLSYFKGRKQSDFFVLRVKGDSMYPTYHDGDIVLVLKQTTLDYSGQIGAVLYDDECGTLKKVEYCQGEDWINLISINPNYPPKRIENEELEHCRIMGIPYMLIREIDN